MVYIEFEIVSRRLKCVSTTHAYSVYQNGGQTDEQVINRYHGSDTTREPETGTRGANFNLDRYGVKNIVLSHFDVVEGAEAEFLQ